MMIRLVLENFFRGKAETRPHLILHVHQTMAHKAQEEVAAGKTMAVKAEWMETEIQKSSSHEALQKENYSPRERDF
jgi:hypothetical protein